MSPSHRSRIAIYNDNASQLAWREAENKGDANTLVRPLGDPGTYFVLVYDLDGAASLDTYTFTLSTVPVVDPHEPNHTFSQPVPMAFGTPTQGDVFPPGDRDFRLLQVTEPGTLHVTVNGVPDAIEVSLRLYNQNGSQLLAQSNLNPGTPLEASVQVRETGLYRLLIYDNGDDAYAVSPYAVTTDFIPAEDAQEPNNRYSEATALSASNQATGLVHPVADVDWFRFEVTETYANWRTNHCTEAELLNPAISGDQADPDLDRVVNVDEYGADTDPRDPDSVLKLLVVNPTGGGTLVDWKGGVHAEPFLDSQQLLGTGGWLCIFTNTAPTPVLNQVTDQGARPDQGAYRIRAEQR